MAGGEIPKWLMDMVHAEYSTSKGKNSDDKKYFCVDCAGHPLTELERNYHAGRNHRIIQAFSVSTLFAFRRDEIVGLEDLGLDTTDIALFLCNNMRSIYPKSRKQNNCRSSKGKVCHNCGYSLTQMEGLYCSILCKLEICGFNPPHNQNAGIEIGLAEMEENGINLDEGIVAENNILGSKKGKNKQPKKYRKTKQMLRVKREHKKKIGENQSEVKASCQQKITAEKTIDDEKLQVLVSVAVQEQKKLSFRKRSRKGIPHRAPLF